MVENMDVVRAGVVSIMVVVCLVKVEVGKQDVVRGTDSWLGVALCGAGCGGV